MAYLYDHYTSNQSSIYNFFSTEEILLDTNTFSISTSFKKIRLSSWGFFFQFQYHQTLKNV